MSEPKIAFPVGYHKFHKTKIINLQLNRLYAYGYTRLEDIQKAAAQIKKLDDYKIAFKNLAEEAVAEHRLINAAFYYRAAEFFVPPSDPDKEVLYHKFSELFYTAFKDDAIERFTVPYETGFLPVFRLAAPSAADSKGAILMHGGFDSFIEEFYSVARYFNARGYEVIAFEGSGQGAALKRYGLPWSIEWERPTRAILGYFKLDAVTLLGISMGGYLCLRAAAFEPRIQRVIAWSVVYDWMQAVNTYVKRVTEWFFKHSGALERAINLKMKIDPYHRYVAQQWMYITKEATPVKAARHIMAMNAANLHSELVTQDVLILTGEEDSFAPLKLHYKQLEELKNAKSVTGRIFTKDEQAQHHCQIGNIGLALDVMANWLAEKS
jgi:pimeloyl-ACP methyl ester carboxylesterase